MKTGWLNSGVLAGLLLFEGIGGIAMAQASEPLEAPPSTQLTWVAEDIVQNGVPMQVQQLQSGLSVGEVLNFYRTQWSGAAQGDGPAFVENQVGEWQTISQLKNDRQVVVQVKPGEAGGAEGFISVADIGATPERDREAEAFPAMSGSQLVSSTRSRDGEKFATTIIYLNSFSVESNGNYYKEEMTADGWSMVHRLVQEDNTVMLFNRQGKSCEIALSDNRGRTVILANILTDES